MASDEFYTTDVGRAIVLDIGSDSLRVGFAQDDSVQATIPSVVGIVKEPTVCFSHMFSSTDEGHSKLGNVTTPPKRDLYIDQNDLLCARQRMEISSFLKNGMIEDWDAFEKVMDYLYAKSVQVESAVHPVLMSEPLWNERAKREQLIEVMFETFKVPAVFLAKNVVLAAYANGTVTGVVVDCGATHTSAVPIVEGFALTEVAVKSPLGGDFISNLCRAFLERQIDVDIVPRCVIAHPDPMNGTDVKLKDRKVKIFEVTQSWRDYMIKRRIQDFQAAVLHVSPSPFDRIILSKRPAISYEIPQGHHRPCGIDRFLIPEAMFDPSVVFPQSVIRDKDYMGVGELVTKCIEMCDIHLKPSLYGNVLITGGNSCLIGFKDRLMRDLTVQIPSNLLPKLKFADGYTDRRFGAWIGGSILASLETCRQFYITSQDYKEKGKDIVKTKCP